MTEQHRLAESWNRGLLIVLSAVVFLSPFVIHSMWSGGYVIHEEPTGIFHLRNTVVLVPLDILQALLVALAIPKAFSLFRSHRLNWSSIASFVLVAFAAVSLASHPSVPGIALVLRWIAAAAVVVAASRLDRRTFRIHVAVPLLATAVIQAAIALVQYFALESVSDHPVFIARGTTQLAYVVAAILLLALTVAVAVAPQGRTRPIWTAGIVLCSAGIATSTMRTAFIGLVIAAVAYAYGYLATGDRRRFGTALAATLLPFGVVAVAMGDPWLQNLRQTLGLGPTGGRSRAETISSGRLKLTRHSLAIIADNPLIGVGPNREAFEAAARFPNDYGDYTTPVHTVPLLAAAEMGIAAGIAYVGYIAALGWRSLRTSPATVAVFASLAIFMLLEHSPYDRPTLIILTGVWMVTLDHLWESRERLPNVASTA